MIRVGLVAFLVLVFVGLTSCVSAVPVSLGAAHDNTTCGSSTGELRNGFDQSRFAYTIATAPASRRGLLHFDLAKSLSAAVIVNSATLPLLVSCTISGTKDTSPRRVSQAWVAKGSNANRQEGIGAPSIDGDATWIRAVKLEQSRTTQCGDRIAALNAERGVDGIDFCSWCLSPRMVKGVSRWRDLPTEDFDWMLIVDESELGAAKRFDSGEHRTVSNSLLLSIDDSVVREQTTIVHPLLLLMAISAFARFTQCWEANSC